MLFFWACGDGCAGGKYTNVDCTCACQCLSGNPEYLVGSDGPCLEPRGGCDSVAVSGSDYHTDRHGTYLPDGRCEDNEDKVYYKCSDCGSTSYLWYHDAGRWYMGPDPENCDSEMSGIGIISNEDLEDVSGDWSEATTSGWLVNSDIVVQCNFDPTPRPVASPPTDKDEAAAAAASGGACDAIEVAGTDYGLLTRFAYDGLYEEAGACNGRPYYKCTCCTAYDPANDVDDPDECLSEKNFHHYVWYDGAAWQLRLYAGGEGDPFGWDECGGGSGWGTNTVWKIRTATWPRRPSRARER